MSLVSKPLFEYRTTFAPISDNFPEPAELKDDLAKMNPKPPRAENWQLVCSNVVTTKKGTFIIYNWERPVAQVELV